MTVKIIHISYENNNVSKRDSNIIISESRWHMVLNYSETRRAFYLTNGIQLPNLHKINVNINESCPEKESINYEFTDDNEGYTKYFGIWCGKLDNSNYIAYGYKCNATGMAVNRNIFNSSFIQNTGNDIEKLIRATVFDMYMGYAKVHPIIEV